MADTQELTKMYIADNLLNTLNISDINRICKEFAYMQAETYYNGLNAEDQEKINQKAQEFIKSQQEPQPS